jgi:hypothetical protein
MRCRFRNQLVLDSSDVILGCITRLRLGRYRFVFASGSGSALSIRGYRARDDQRRRGRDPARHRRRLGHKLIRKGVLPATQLMQSAPWQIPVAALETEAVTTGVREIVGPRPKFYKRFQEDKTLRLPGF